MSDDILASLSPRQREVFRLIGRGVPIKNIGYEMGISEFTVRDHIKLVRGKLPNRTNETIARMLVAFERTHPQSWGEAPQSVEKPSRSASSGSGLDEQARSGQEEISPEPRPADALLKASTKGRFEALLSLLFPPVERLLNDLTLDRRLLIIATRTIAGLLAVASIFVAVSILSMVLFAIARHGD